MKNETEINKKSLIVKCNDNCSALSIDKWNDDDVYYITTYKSYNATSIIGKIKDIWKIIKGLDVINNELILNDDDYQKIKNFN
jgi:hypothetical protein